MLVDELVKTVERQSKKDELGDLVLDSEKLVAELEKFVGVSIRLHTTLPEKKRCTIEMAQFSRSWGGDQFHNNSIKYFALLSE